MPNRKQITDLGALATFHQTIMELFIHHDQLFWHCLDFLIIIQIGILTISMAVKDSFLSPIVIFIGIISSIVLFFIARKSLLDRNINIPLSDELACLLTKEIEKNHSDKENKKILRFRCSTDEPFPKFYFRGRTLLYFTIGFFGVTDLTILVLSLIELLA